MTATSLLRPGRSSPASLEALANPTLVVLGIATVIEVLVLRLGTRLAIHIPASPALESPYNAVAAGGRYAFFVGATSLIVLLAILAATGLRSRRLPGLLIGSGVGAFATGAALLRAGSDDTTLTTCLSLAGIVLAGSAVVVHRWRLALCVAPLCLAVWLNGVYLVLQEEGTGPAFTTWFPSFSEALVVVLALATPVALRVRPARATIAVGALSGLVVLTAFIANPSTSRILLLWSDGLPGRLPAAAYAIAAGFYLAAIFDSWRRAHHDVAIALLLLLGAGVAIQNTYQTGLLVCALAVLASPGFERDRCAMPSGRFLATEAV